MVASDEPAAGNVGGGVRPGAAGSIGAIVASDEPAAGSVGNGVNPGAVGSGPNGDGSKPPSQAAESSNAGRTSRNTSRVMYDRAMRGMVGRHGHIAPSLRVGRGRCTRDMAA